MEIIMGAMPPLGPREGREVAEREVLLLDGPDEDRLHAAPQRKFSTAAPVSFHTAT